MIKKKRMEYVCAYCGTRFKQLLISFSGVPSSVPCVKCGNFLKPASGREVPFSEKMLEILKKMRGNALPRSMLEAAREE